MLRPPAVVTESASIMIARIIDAIITEVRPQQPLDSEASRVRSAVNGQGSSSQQSWAGVVVQVTRPAAVMRRPL